MAIKRLDHINFITWDMPATVDFYTRLIGLSLGERLAVDKTNKAMYFYVPGDESVAVLHVMDATTPKVSERFERYANLAKDNQGQFSTGAIDHVCLALDGADYEVMVAKLDAEGLEYQTWCHENIPLKQIWLLDPNGIRVELSFPAP